MRIRRSVFRAGRHEQVMTPPREDIYREDAKLHDPTTCRDCGATYHMGRWTWSAGPDLNLRNAFCRAIRQAATYMRAFSSCAFRTRRSVGPKSSSVTVLSVARS